MLFIYLQMSLRLCPIPFDTSTCWSRGPNSWLRWRWTMLRRMHKRRSGLVFHISWDKSKSNHKWLLHQDEADACVERKNDPKAAPVENGLSTTSAPAGHTPVTTTPKASAASQQTVTTGIIHPPFNSIPIFVSLILILTLILILMSFLNADTAKPPAKSEDLVLSVLIGLYYLYFSFLKKLVGWFYY